MANGFNRMVWSKIQKYIYLRMFFVKKQFQQTIY